MSDHIAYASLKNINKASWLSYMEYFINDIRQLPWPHSYCGGGFGYEIINGRRLFLNIEGIPVLGDGSFENGNGAIKDNCLRIHLKDE